MKVAFTCPGCGVAGAVDAVHAGKVVRCKHCGFRSAVPTAGEPEPEMYALDEPTAGKTEGLAVMQAEGSVFVASGGGQPARAPRPGRPANQAPDRARAGVTQTLPGGSG